MFGIKIKKGIHNLGKKYKNNQRQIGRKSRNILNKSDVILRKSENTLQNKLIPASMIVAPETTPYLVGGLGAIKGTRAGIHVGREISNNIEKHGIRKKLAENAEKDNQHQIFY